MKRTSTRDIKPQWFNFPTITQSGADTTTSLAVSMPVARIPGAASVTVIEILRIYAAISNLPAIAAVAESLDTETLVLSTSNNTTTDVLLNHASVIAFFLKTQRGAFTAGGTYARMGDQIMEFNLTDDNGNGVLVATDSLFLQLQSTGTGATNNAQVKMLYRFKSIGAMEFVGIVQSQQ